MRRARSWRIATARVMSVMPGLMAPQRSEATSPRAAFVICVKCELYCEADVIQVALDQRTAKIIDPETVRQSGYLGRLRRDYRWAYAAGEGGHLDDFRRLNPLPRESVNIAAAPYEKAVSEATG